MLLSTSVLLSLEKTGDIIRNPFLYHSGVKMGRYFPNFDCITNDEITRINELYKKIHNTKEDMIIPMLKSKKISVYLEDLIKEIFEESKCNYPNKLILGLI